MTSPARPLNRPSDPTAIEALLLAFGVWVLFWFLVSPSKVAHLADRLAQFSDHNAAAITFMSSMALFILIWVCGLVGRTVKDLAKPKALRREEKGRPRAMAAFVLLVFGAFGSLGSSVLAKTTLAPVDLFLFPFAITNTTWTTLFGILGFLTSVGLGQILHHNRRVLPFIKFRSGLPKFPGVRDAIVLGAINESESREDAREKALLGKSPQWVAVGLKGLTGNLFISGSIGSGKSQVLLQFLRQLLSNFESSPSLLAIDPKRTFVRELRNIIAAAGLSDRLIWVSLNGSVRLNPIWVEGMLRNSAFTTIANSLKLASINFIGTTGDSKFWEQSSFNLLKNSLIYCAARYDYFTFKELYRALVQARDEGLASDLVDCLTAKSWDEEERGNIESAIQYFSNEFSQMDEKIRTSILATATSFLNDFLEYRVSRVLSPAKDEINLVSFREAIRDGKLICLNIENDALARSIGTLIKLLYQEAVLERVTDGDLLQSRYALLVMDEYQDVATSGGGAGIGDDRYLAKARESRSITIAATQSVSSLENTIKSEAATRELLQGFRTRIFGNSTDPKTIRVFQEPRGTEEVERSSRSFSETSPDAKMDLLFGGYDSTRSNVSEGTSTSLAKEYPVTAKEFSRLRTFEAFAQIFDGLETSFEKLYLKPYFLANPRTPHRRVLDELRAAARVQRVPSRWRVLAGLVAAIGLTSSIAGADVLFPSVCSAVKTSQFRSCLQFDVGACMCGFPPRPCAQLNYYVPATFIEVWPNAGQSFFSKHPGASVQLVAHSSERPFGIDDEMGGFAFQAHAMAVPLAKELLVALPCAGTRLSKPCFDVMSEDLGSNWTTGSADLLQPKFLAWGLAKKACLLKGAASGFASQSDRSIGSDSGGCSYPLGFMPKYPPSTREACNGWGLFYPRSGVSEGASRAVAALQVASRLKSLGVEIARTIPGDMDEKWQMLFPQSSACFLEGVNPGWLEGGAGLREEQRLLGKPNGYLFLVWKKVSCCRDVATIATTEAALIAIGVACQAVPGGGV